jgi:hypothetical protein
VEDCFAEADAKGVQYVWAEVKQVGRSAAAVLTEELPGLLASLTFRKSMRWRPEAAFSRPLRWLLALHGGAVLPLTYAGLQAGAGGRMGGGCVDGYAISQARRVMWSTVYRGPVYCCTRLYQQSLCAMGIALECCGELPLEASAHQCFLPPQHTYTHSHTQTRPQAPPRGCCATPTSQRRMSRPQTSTWQRCGVGA